MTDEIEDEYDSDDKGRPMCPSCGWTLPCPPGGMAEGFAGLDLKKLGRQLDAAKKAKKPTPEKVKWVRTTCENEKCPDREWKVRKGRWPKPVMIITSVGEE